MKGKKTIILLIVIVIAVVATITCITLNTSKKFKLSFKDRLEETNNFKTIASVDGWIQVQGTNIDMPVLYPREKLYGDEDYHYAWRGSYFPEEGYTRKTIGSHNVLNVSSTPIQDMTNLVNFEPLMAFTYYHFAKDNLYIKYTNKYNQTEELYKIYAIGFYDYETDDFEAYSKEEKDVLEDYISNAKKNSIYEYDVDVNSNDELIMLYTCTRYFGLNEKQQIFINARKLRSDEKAEKYNVEKTDLFTKLGMHN